MALPQKNRLGLKKDFDRIFKQGKVLKGHYLFLKFVGSKLSRSRGSIVVSSKVAQKAVQRNKIKRRLGGVLKAFVGKSDRPADIVVVVQNRQTALQLTAAAVELESLLSKI